MAFKKRNTLPVETQVRHDTEFKERLTHVSNSSIAVIGIRTRELFRAQALVQIWALEQSLEVTDNRTGKKRNTHMYFESWTCLSGWQKYPEVTDPTVLPDDFDTPVAAADEMDPKMSQPVYAIKAIERMKDPGAYTMMAPFQLDHPMVQQAIRDFVQRCQANAQRLVLLMPEATEIPPQLADDIYLIDLKTPSDVELREAWDTILSNVDEDKMPALDENDLARIIRNCAGMSLHEFNVALSLSLIEVTDRLPDVTADDFVTRMLRSKVEMLKRLATLELMDSISLDQVGGMDLFKAWLQRKRKAMLPVAHLAGLDKPKGCLLVGPPGTGKSLSARAVASIFGVPCIKFKFDAIFQGIVGSTEANMRMTLAMIDAVAPCVLFADEIDKMFGGIGQGGDSGVGQRVLGTFLNWMQERKGPPVFVLMTANNVSHLPAELIRKGRLDEIFAGTFPGVDERAQILKIHAEKRGMSMSPDEYRIVAEKTPRYVGAELELAIVEAQIDLFNEETGEVGQLTARHLLPYLEGMTPLAVAFADRVEPMNQWAEKNAKPTSSGMSFTKGDDFTTTSLVTRARPVPRLAKPTGPRIGLPRTKPLDIS